MRTFAALILFLVAMTSPGISGAAGLLDSLAQCDAAYFRALKTHKSALTAHGVTVVDKGDVLRVVPPDFMDIAYANALLEPPIVIEGLTISGFINGFVDDEVGGAIAFVWGVSTPATVDDAAQAINTLLPEEKRAEKLYEGVYVRSEHLQLENKRQGWKAAMALRYGAPPKDGVAKGLIIERVLSLDNVPPEGRTWITCELHGKSIPPDLLTLERPDITQGSQR